MSTPFLHRLRFTTCAALLLVEAAAHAQAPAPPAPVAPAPTVVGRMRQEFEANVLKSTLSLNDYYERRLASLEADLASEGDYAQAKLAKQRRDELLEAGKSASDNSGALNISVPVELARLTGVQARSGELSGWRTATSAAEWTLTKLLPGAYRIEFSYSMDSSSNVTPGSSRQPAEETEFLFREITLLAGASKNVLPLKLAGNKGVMTAAQVPGLLQVTKSPFVLRLSCSAYYPLNSIAIRDIKLVPVMPTTDASTAAPAAPATSPAADFQKLRKEQEAKLLAVRKPLTAEYLAALAKLATHAKPEAADAIESEQRRVNKLASSSSLAKVTASALDGYDDVSDVHFVPDPANTGDSFKVEHQGELFYVRLAWVACPPVSAEDKRRLSTTMDHFGADEVVALYLGSSAKEFTELYLQARPLRLLLRSKQPRAKGEPVAALVFLEDIGLYQNVLIDNGFAIVDPPANPGKGLVESAMLKSLQDREKAARQHTPALGGWSLGTKGGTGSK